LSTRSVAPHCLAQKIFQIVSSCLSSLYILEFSKRRCCPRSAPIPTQIRPSLPHSIDMVRLRPM
jgi:hypothetical protein